MSAEARPNNIEEDREAAMSLLRLHVAGHRYVKGCKTNGGLACYSCRTVEWLEAHSDYRHVSPGDASPSPKTGTAAVPDGCCSACGSKRFLFEDGKCMQCGGSARAK